MSFFKNKIKAGVYVSLVILSTFILTSNIDSDKSTPDVFPYRTCKAELKLFDVINDTVKTANIKVFFLFNTNKTGNMEYSGTFFDEKQEYLMRGRIDFNYHINKNILDLTNIRRTLSERDVSSLLGITLPEYLSINTGSITFSLQIITSSKVVVTRYTDPLYIMTCNK